MTSRARQYVAPAPSRRRVRPVAAASVVVALAAGLAMRLYGIQNSLWVDEFGTLWAVEGDLGTLFERVYEFHGQSPFYYLIAWSARVLLGESELALRLPSLAAGLAAPWFLYWAGAELAGRRAGWIAALLLWFSPYSIRWSAEARPYGFAVLFACLMLWGFARATKRGDVLGRALFVVGGVGLFWCNYVLALFGLGFLAAYLLLPSSRIAYGWRKFGADLTLLPLVASLSLPRLWGLWGRREALELGNGHWSVLILLATPAAACVLLAASPGVYVRLFDRPNRPQAERRGYGVLLLLAAIAPVVAVVSLERFGNVNLLVDRYLAWVVPAWALLGGYFVARTRFPPAGSLALAAALLIYGIQLRKGFEMIGTYSGAGQQDWMSATALLDEQLAQTPGAPVLYRSGFIEDDRRAAGESVPDVVFAPLRRPGEEAPERNIIPLTFRWRAGARSEPYVAGSLPQLRTAPTFYYLSCACITDDASAQYDRRLAYYLANELSVRGEPLDAGRGMVLWRFRQLGSAEPNESPNQR